MLYIKKMFLLVAVVLLMIPVNSNASSCPNLYPPNFKIPNFKELCNSFFVNLVDKEKPAVIMSSERLQMSPTFSTIERLNNFRSDPRWDKTSKNIDYTGIGLDRGHMAPADDASTYQEGRDTFLLSNMTPQEPTLNRQAWRVLEEDVRNMVRNYGGVVYVVTIAVYNSPRYIGRLPIPTGYWKIVYLGADKKMFFAENKPNAKVVQYKNVDLQKLLRPVW